ncbi:MAG TPA: SemiSWEET transporter [Candidatus Nanoarchaeia archaeon]|nr:SemiSWEET transporter [Candidatus Nanoarchaeia archaeon]
MDSFLLSLLGLTAAACTTASFLPQVIRSIRTKQTKDLSLPMCVLLVTGMLLWLLYGILIQDIPIIAANSVALGLMTVLLFLKLKYG